MPVIHNMQFSEYLAVDALSASGIKNILKSPLHFQTRKTAPREETPALILGSAVHCAVLEPYAFGQRYIEAPAIDRRTTAGKEAWRALEASGKEVLSASEYWQTMDMSAAIFAHPTASELLKEGRPEVSCFSELECVPAKCRVDWLRDDGIVVDLKTTDDASPSGFRRSVAKYGYHIQAAWYLDVLQSLGVAAHTFVFVAVEKSAPYGIGIYELDDDAIELGRERYRHAAALYKHCSETNDWPGYDSGVVSLSVPAWAFQQIS